MAKASRGQSSTYKGYVSRASSRFVTRINNFFNFFKINKHLNASSSQSGSIIAVIFAALIMLGGLGAGYQTLLKGPVATIAKGSKAEIARASMEAAARLVSVPGTTPLDCDSDGVIEPMAFAAPATGVSAPAGGGVIPAAAGAAKLDPWGTPYGYCVWDHGSKTVTDNVAGCGGSTAKRLVGGNVQEAVIVAIISAGPDKIFQTSCDAWLDANTDNQPDIPLPNKPGASDDVIVTSTMEQLLAGGETKIQYYPDEACTPDALGLMRLDMGVIQICSENGWEEIGAAVVMIGTFAPVTGAQLSSVHTSNQISFEGFHGEKPLSVSGGAQILVNGVLKGATAMITSGDNISIRATASNTPETTLTFTIALQHTSTTWTIRTRDKTPAALTITPTSSNAMNVTGPGSPAYGSVVTFLVRNTGEISTQTLQSTVLSNTSNFEFYSGGNYVGDGCGGKILNHNGTCVLDVRPKAVTGGSLSSNLTARDGAVSVVATLAGNASNFSCANPFGGADVAHGASITGYSASSVAWNQLCSSVQGTRTCNNGTLSNPTFSHQNCAITTPLNCDLGGQSVNHLANHAFFTATTPACNVTCESISQVRTCTNGALSGTASFDQPACTFTPCLSCTIDGVTRAHGASADFYLKSVSANCAGEKITRSCDNGTYSGTATYNKSSCVINDTTPDNFAFTDLTGVAVSATQTSNIVQITGISDLVNTSISGNSAQYRICVDSACSTVATNWTTAASTIQNNQYVQLRMGSHSAGWGTVTTTMTVGTVSKTWSVRTAQVCDTWYAQDTPSEFWNDVAYGNGTYVAVADTGTQRVMTSTDGVTWTARTVPSGDWQTIAFGGGGFVAFSHSTSNSAMYSTDGINWTIAPSAGSGAQLHYAASNGSRIVSSSRLNRNNFTTTDGVNFTNSSLPSNSNVWHTIAYGDGKFVTLSGVSYKFAAYSTNGTSWSVANTPTNADWRGLAYGGGLWVGVGVTGSFLTSPDAETWTSRSGLPNQTWRGLAYGGGKFIAISSDGTNRMAVSTNGTTWTTQATVENNGWTRMHFLNGRFVVVAGSGSAKRVMTMIPCS